MNRGQLVFECSRTLGLDDTAGSDELILMQRWANRGVVDFLIKTHAYLEIGQMALSIGTSNYRIDPNILAMDEVTLPDTSGNPIRLDIIDSADLQYYLANTTASIVSPLYASIDGTLMRVAPAPTSAVTLTYFYVPKPTEMTADGTTGADANDPSTATYGGIPTEFHDAIFTYMLWKGAEYDDKGGGFYRGHAFAPGYAYQTVYEQMCKDAVKRLRQKAGRGMHAGKVGYPDRFRVGRRNDTYPRG